MDHFSPTNKHISISVYI